MSFFAGFEIWRFPNPFGDRLWNLLLIRRSGEDAVQQGGGRRAGVAAVVGEPPVRQGGHALRQGEAGGILQEDRE